MLTAFGPNPATMFLSWRGGARASAPPRQDDFREVFKGRLLARLASRSKAAPETGSRGTARQSRLTKRHQAKAGESGLRTASRSGESRQTAEAGERNREDRVRRTRKQDESQAAVAGLAADAGQSATGPRPVQVGANPSPPQALQDLITFLQSLPNGSLKIAPDQIQAVANYLLSAGLPQEEVERLLLSPDFTQKGLTAEDLLVCCPRNILTKSIDFLKDRISGGNPGKGLAISIVVADKIFDPGD
jgi:hypothetical protein